MRHHAGHLLQPLNQKKVKAAIKSKPTVTNFNNTAAYLKTPPHWCIAYTAMKVIIAAMNHYELLFYAPSQTGTEAERGAHCFVM